MEQIDPYMYTWREMENETGCQKLELFHDTI